MKIPHNFWPAAAVGQMQCWPSFLESVFPFLFFRFSSPIFSSSFSLVCCIPSSSLVLFCILLSIAFCFEFAILSRLGSSIFASIWFHLYRIGALHLDSWQHCIWTSNPLAGISVGGMFSWNVNDRNRELLWCTNLTFTQTLYQDSKLRTLSWFFFIFKILYNKSLRVISTFFQQRQFNGELQEKWYHKLLPNGVRYPFPYLKFFCGFFDLKCSRSAFSLAQLTKYPN